MVRQKLSLRKVLIRITIVLTLIAILAAGSLYYYFFIHGKKFYFSGVYVTAYYGEQTKDIYFSDPDLFFQKGELKAEVKTFFLEDEMFMEPGEDYSLVSISDKNEVTEVNRFNIKPHEYFAMVYYPSTETYGEVTRFNIMFGRVLRYSDKIKKIQFYKNSKLIAETNVKPEKK